MELTVHPLSQNPDQAWEQIFQHKAVEEVKLPPPTRPVGSDSIRFVCMSDTHCQLRDSYRVPDGDVFIHAGDFTMHGRAHEIDEFNKWLGRLPHRHKIVIAGNHEITFDEKLMNPAGTHPERWCFKRLKTEFWDENEKHRAAIVKKGLKSFNAQQLSNATYLQDSSVEVYGVKIYGSPWQPVFGGWAFNLERGEECLAKWRLIPPDVDILITHGPPLGFGDLAKSDLRAGCVDLLETVQKRVKPTYHIFGHIHEGYGVTSDGNTTFINASICDTMYDAVNDPIVFDMPLPAGSGKI